MSTNSTNVGTIDLSLILNSDKFSRELNNVDKHANRASSKISSSLMKIGKAVAIAFSVTKIVQFGKTCLEVATETTNAWIGLNSILTGQGKSFNQAKQFIQDYVSDGLVPLNNAVAAYKNLSLRGYNSEQIQKTMNALKNSATFARQSTYSLGEAVQTATEGLKNENSVVVDNAGVTKNVSKMWEDYAKSIGKTKNQLTQAEKIQAEVNGILEETKFQSNDAAIYANTYSGKLAQLNSAFINMKTAIGNAIQPIAKIFIPVITNALNAVTRLFTAFSGLLALFGLKTDLEIASDKIGSMATGASDTSEEIDNIGKSATKTAKKLKSLASFDTAQVLKDNDTSGSGSGTSKGTSGVSVSDVNISDGIKEQVEDIGKIFNNINFDPLINSFNRVKEAAKPIIENIGKGLEWLYNNVLVPLAKWTIEDLLPAFLNILAGALNVVNKAIEDIKPIFQWFWDSVLAPIAKWTGGVIVDTLNGIGNALKWISDNEVAMSIIEGIAIAIGLVAGALTLYNTAMAICNVVTGIFAGIMTVLTSPITIIIAIIGALIAVIILCIKHWDEIKEVVNNAVEAIKEKVQQLWSKVSFIFDGIKDVISTVLGFIWNIFSTVFQAIWNIVSPILNAIWSVISTIFQAIWTIISSILGSVWNIFSQIFGWIWELTIKVFEGIWNVISPILNRVWETIKSVLGKIQEIWSSIWNKISSVVTNVWNGIWNGIKGVINKILGGIEKFVNGTIKGINKLLSGISNVANAIGSLVGIKPINLKLSEISLPRLAQGGYVKANTPQLAIVGDNKRHGEIIAPEDKIEDIYRKVQNEQALGNADKIVQLLNVIIETLKSMGFDFNLYLDSYELSTRLERTESKRKFATNGGL